MDVSPVGSRPPRRGGEGQADAMAVLARYALAGAMIWAATGGAAQEVTRPQPRPGTVVAASAVTPLVAAEEAPALAAPAQPAPAPAAKPVVLRDPNRGAVTNLPLPRFVSLKGREGNARRGPGLTHRIDWVFTRAGMPLKITAEFEHWRRVEDAEGVGGWVHYSLLSGVRSALVAVDLAEFRARPSEDADIRFRAERNVVGWIEECLPDWCDLSIDGEEGWVRKSALWGVLPDETVE